MTCLSLTRGRFFFVDGNGFDGGRARVKSAHDHARAAAQGVHAQKLVRRTMLDAHEALGFFIGQYHAKTLS